MSKKPTVETIKADSEGLRGPLNEELANSEAYFSEAGKQLIKFHGIYQQHDRDVRRGEAEHDHYHQFMLRTKVPGGQLTAEQYLVHDDLASAYGNGTLRITTRECFQLHGLIKNELRDTLRHLNHALVTSFGACGDVVRNVMACPAPTSDPQRLAVQEFALQLTEALFPRTSSYHQIWLDGEAMIEDKEIPDPLYGKTYLPRKFKIAIAHAGDNCVDIFTNDIGLVALFDEAGILAGFNLLVGGGMSMTHNNEDTFPRLADVLVFIEPEQVLETVKAVVTIHRDFGNRENRKNARLKYILHEWGTERFREELQRRVDFPLQTAREMPAFEIHDHLGWHEQGDGRWYLGIPVDSGRIIDRDDMCIRTGLRTIITRYNLPVRLTAQQNILLTNIEPQDRAAIEALLAEYHILTVEQISATHRQALACPAMPTCGLAIAEAERVMPEVVSAFEALLTELNIPDEPIMMRMTGCPNGCARPYVAEIGFVGRALNKYTIFLGGNHQGTRLAESFLDLIHLDQLVPTLRPIVTLFRDTHEPGEHFGDFCRRIGFETLRELISQSNIMTEAGD